MSRTLGSQNPIPFSPPDIRPEDIDAVVQVLRSGWITTGPVSREFEEELTAFTGCAGVVLQNSCTSALEQALRASGVGPGDDVVVPAYTYTATAAAALHVGAKVIMVDTAPGRFVPSPAQFRDTVTPDTKAIIVVDLGGIPYPTEELIALLAESREGGRAFDLERPVVIADAAHSLGAERGGKRVGELADLTAFSFHAVKNLTTAEGGALGWRDGLVESNEAFYQQLRTASLHGQTKDAFAKSKPGAWEYDIVDAAYKSNMPDVLAALGLSQLRRYPETLQRRRELVAQYGSLLDACAIVEPHEGPNFASSAHLALCTLPPEMAAMRDDLIAEMAERGITCNVHYKPLPLLSAYANLGFRIEDFPNALAQYQRGITLPLHGLLTDDDVKRVAAELRGSLD